MDIRQIIAINKAASELGDAVYSQFVAVINGELVGEQNSNALDLIGRRLIPTLQSVAADNDDEELSEQIDDYLETIEHYHRTGCPECGKARMKGDAEEGLCDSCSAEMGFSDPSPCKICQREPDAHTDMDHEFKADNDVVSFVRIPTADEWGQALKLNEQTGSSWMFAFKRNEWRVVLLNDGTYSPPMLANASAFDFPEEIDNIHPQAVDAIQAANASTTHRSQGV